MSSVQTHANTDLLLTIARCPVMAGCLDAEQPSHPCAAVTGYQWQSIDAATRIEYWRRAHQLPEPWVGHLAEAPILFVSSNPSIRGQVTPEGLAAPSRDGITWISTDEAIIDRFDDAFDKHIVDGVRSIGAKRATRYWSSIKNRAQELIPHRPVRPGRDYALTELVHCKSPKEIGVPEAAKTCGDRYLRPILETSAARVIIGIGAHARRGLVAHLRLSSVDGAQQMQIGGRDRLIVFLPAPNAHGGPKTFAGKLSPSDLIAVQRWVAGGQS